MSPPAAVAFETGIHRWQTAAKSSAFRIPRVAGWSRRFVERARGPVLRRPAELPRIRAWERRHGFRLPSSLKAWLRVSDGLYQDGPLIHPLAAIGPMIPFARVPDLLVQPESWFELGNPGSETVCIDLGYRWPGGDCPIFASGDDEQGSRPRLIATSFEEWLCRLVDAEGRRYWLDADFQSLGDPWECHRRYAPAPPFPERLRPLLHRILPLIRPGADELAIAAMLGIPWTDVEALMRYLQHVPTSCGGS